MLLENNSFPQIDNTDHGIRRRIQAILFNRTLTMEEQNKDLAANLEAELTGILNWAIGGFLNGKSKALTLQE